MVPISSDPGELKYVRKWGPVIIPDITLEQCEPELFEISKYDALPLIISKLKGGV